MWCDAGVRRTHSTDSGLLRFMSAPHPPAPPQQPATTDAARRRSLIALSESPGLAVMPGASIYTLDASNDVSLDDPLFADRCGNQDGSAPMLYTAGQELHCGAVLAPAAVHLGSRHAFHGLLTLSHCPVLKGYRGIHNHLSCDGSCHPPVFQLLSRSFVAFMEAVGCGAGLRAYCPTPSIQPGQELGSLVGWDPRRTPKLL